MMILTPLTGIPIIHPGDDLGEVIWQALSDSDLTLAYGDIIVVAQKIVSKSEGRFVSLETVTPSPDALALAKQTYKDPRLVELNLRESKEVLRAKLNTLIVEHRLGFICANAGIDHSNVLTDGNSEGDWVLLLPEDPDASAQRIRARLESASGVSLGVMIIDSHGRAWRLGTVGVAIGLAGLPGLVDLRGEPDLFGTTLQITQVGAADELAAAASLVMGQAAEGQPVVHVRGFPYSLRESSLNELLRPRQEDLFR
jgi:coenzyme F420-0:L-glutamate ligase/coenzyme F420-1:gamma-L-glutamate ligase